jgi:hypothetical protein
VFSMTNRLLGIVIAFALTSGIVAHAASAPQRPLAPVTLAAAASSLPADLETAASHVTEAATSAVDPAGAIRAAYQRDHVALEHLRQQAAQLKGSAHPAFNQFISDQEAALLDIERTALASSRPASSTTIAAMDTLVTAAQSELNRELSQPGSIKSNGSKQGGSSQGQSGKSHGGNH